MIFRLLLTQTLTLAFRKGGGAWGVMGFYVLMTSLFAFALSPEMLAGKWMSVASVALLLSAVVATPLLFERDAEDGTLEQHLLLPTPLEWVMLASFIGQWCAYMLPIVVCTPLFAFAVGLEGETIANIALRSALLAPTLLALMSFTAALTLAARGSGVMQALVSLPLSVPVLIFAGEGSVWLLAAFAFASVPLSCFINASLVRASYT